jgi:hypothetical protein
MNILIHFILDKEELPQEWTESVIVHIYKKSPKTDCSNYRGIDITVTNYFKFFSPPPCPDRYWVPLSLLPNGYQGLFHWG